MTIFNTIDQVSKKWLDDFIATRIARLRSIEGSTHNLEKSFRKQVFTDAQLGLKLIEIRFLDYGRYIDMKNKQRPDGGGDVIKELESWVERHGLTNKKFKGSTRTANQIAWGILKSKNKPRQRKWMAGKYAEFSKLYDSIASSLPEVVAKEITRKLTP